MEKQCKYEVFHCFHRLFNRFSLSFPPFPQSFQHIIGENFITECIFYLFKIHNITEIKTGRIKMIKGVNKKVLEINNPSSIYFDKAVLYLKPNMTCVPQKLLKREAEQIINEISPQSHKYKRLCKLFMCLSAIFSSVSAYLIIYLAFF